MKRKGTDMLSYSPCYPLRGTNYPAMFIGTGLWDSQVQYWEPAKYVARLRNVRTDNNLQVLRTQMEAGHGGSSGRFQRYHDLAEYYSFMMNQLGIAGIKGVIGIVAGLHAWSIL